MEKSISMLQERDKYIGLATGDTSETVSKYWDDMGFHMMAAGADFGMLQAAMVKNRKTLEKICKK